MRALLGTVLILGGMLLLGACATAEESDEDPTATAKPSVTATAAANTATATPAGAAASATPRRDFVRRPTLPTRTPTTAPPPVQTTVAQPPVVQTAAPPPPVQTAAPQPTAAPPVQTATAQVPYWETWVPLEPVTPGTMVELSIHNANGAPGETYDVAMRVVLPDLTDSVQQGIVSGSDWLTFYFSDTWQTGIYDVIFGLPQSDLIYAETWFEVASTQPTQPEWQTSAPREAVASGTTVEVGLRNMWGVPGECYDFTVEVYDPEGYYASGNDTVCADQWTYLTYSDTWTSGYYDISWYIGDQFVASDYFQVGY